MDSNMFTSGWHQLKALIEYRPPADPDPFVLDESRPMDSQPAAVEPESQARLNHVQLEAMLRFSRRLAEEAGKIAAELKKEPKAEVVAGWRRELAALSAQWRELAPLTAAYRLRQPAAEEKISTSLTENRRALSAIYRLPLNKDIVVREIALAGIRSGLLVYMEGLVDGRKLDQFVLAPLLADGWAGLLAGADVAGQIAKEVIPNGQVRPEDTMAGVAAGVNDGDTALFIDGVAEALVIETKGWEHRSVSTPHTEQTVRGSLAAFSENLRVNTGLIRSILRTSDLVTEMVKIGQRGQLNCAVMYIASIANATLVAEVIRRLKGIETDYVVDSGQLVQFIDDHPNQLFPQTISTERPDRAAAGLAEGRLALVLEGNPFVHILPVSFFSFFHSGEDFSLKSGIANFMRILRLFGALISTVLPSLYLALSYFHQEAMPTELLLAVAGSRENVPFPAWFEVFMMEISFELIREAGVRIPGVLGSTIGIVGAIILGQAAVTAKLVSPIVVVVIAITGLSSFTIPEYRMASAVRLVRFVLLIMATVMGLVGLATTLLLLTALLCSMKSYGMPYLVPVSPRATANFDVVIRGPVYNQELRPDALQTKEQRRQPTISRVWKKKEPKD